MSTQEEEYTESEVTDSDESSPSEETNITTLEEFVSKVSQIADRAVSEHKYQKMQQIMGTVASLAHHITPEEGRKLHWLEIFTKILYNGPTSAIVEALGHVLND